MWRAPLAAAAALLALLLAPGSVDARVRCPVGQASYHQLRVAGFMLYRARRMREGRKCFQDAMRLYLARFSQVRANPDLAEGPDADKAREHLQDIARAQAEAARRGGEEDPDEDDAAAGQPALGKRLPPNRAAAPAAPARPARPFFSGSAERDAVAAEYARQLAEQRSRLSVPA